MDCLVGCLRLIVVFLLYFLVAYHQCWALVIFIMRLSTFGHPQLVSSVGIASNNHRALFFRNQIYFISLHFILLAIYIYLTLIHKKWFKPEVSNWVTLTQKDLGTTQ